MRYLIIFIFIFYGCSAPSDKPDTAQIDSLIDKGDLELASVKIRKALAVAGLDSLTIKKLTHRRFLVQKEKIFRPVAEKLNSKDSSGAYRQILQCRARFSKFDTLQKRWLWHDYYSLLSRYMALKKDSSAWVSTGVKALDYPTRKHQADIMHMQDYAFYFARQKKYLKARDWLDRAIRSFDRKYVSGPYMDVYQDYFDGKFESAFERLKNIPDDKKIKQWRSVQKFFKLYAKYLTTENRYRLW